MEQTDQPASERSLSSLRIEHLLRKQNDLSFFKIEYKLDQIVYDNVWANTIYNGSFQFGCPPPPSSSPSPPPPSYIGEHTQTQTNRFYLQSKGKYLQSFLFLFVCSNNKFSGNSLLHLLSMNGCRMWPK